MATFDEVLNEISDKIRKNGGNSLETTAAVANYIGISPAQLSRIKSGKSTLTDNVIEHIVNKIAEFDKELAHTFAGKLKDVQFESVKENLNVTTHRETSGILVSKYSINRAEELFDALSKSYRNSLLCISYHDLPQAGESGAFPYLTEVVGKAVKGGTSLALFQPFGTAEKLFEMHSIFNKNIEEHLTKNKPKHPKAEMFAGAYWYLFRLAQSVRKVCIEIKNHSGESEAQVVLYEAQKEKPSFTACGLQSRLFFADYYEGSKHEIKIFDWVTAPKDEHYFIERNTLDINIEAVRAQFYPITTYWEKQKEEEKKLPIKGELDKAYEDFGMKKILGMEEQIKWKDWSPPNEKK